MSDYVKVKKEDLLKTHKESRGDVQKVLEGLYPGELDKRTIPLHRIGVTIEPLSGESAEGMFYVAMRVDGEEFGRLLCPKINFEHMKEYTLEPVLLYDTVVRLVRK